jgi:hypothetical protein
MTLFNRNQAHKSAEKEIKLKQEVVIDSKFYFVYVIFLSAKRGSISNRSDEAKWLFISFVRINEVDSIFAHLKYYTMRRKLCV